MSFTSFEVYDFQVSLKKRERKENDTEILTEMHLCNNQNLVFYFICSGKSNEK